MSSDIPQGPEPIEPRRPRGNRVLLGCAGAAIGAVIVILVCVAAFVAWLRTPGVPLQGNSIVDGDTVLYAELHVRPGDAVAMELVSKAVGAQANEQAADGQEIPAPLRWALGRASGKPLTSDLEKTLPLIVMITRQDAGPGARPPALLAVSFPKLGNRVRLAGWIASFIAGWSDDDGELTGEKYKDETILALRDDDDGGGERRGEGGEESGASGYGGTGGGESDRDSRESGAGSDSAVGEIVGESGGRSAGSESGHGDTGDAPGGGAAEGGGYESGGSASTAGGGGPGSGGSGADGESGDARGESFGTVYISIVGSDFLIARGAASLKGAIDRIKTPAPQDATAGRPAILAGRPEDALLYVAAREGHAAWAIDLLGRASPEFASLLEPLTEGAGTFTLWARLETSDLLVGELRIAAGSPGEEEADGYAGSVTSVVGGEEIAFALEPLPRAPGVRHAWRLRVSGLERAGIKALKHLDDHDKRREGR